MLRWYDRKFSNDYGQTRQIIQNDYENVYLGIDLLLEFRYGNMLTILAFTFMYSSSIPLLYPIAMTFFMMTYWVDKFLIFRCYKEPVKFDAQVALKTLSWYKYILFLHALGFVLMYSNS